MLLTPVLIVLFGSAGVCALVALAHGLHARRRWRARRRLAAIHRALWSAIFALLALLGALGGASLLGYRRLGAEALVAHLDTRMLGAQHYAVTLALPDGEQQAFDLRGDEWQVDARVIKWKTGAVMFGAPPLYRLDRLSGRYRAIEQERSTPKSALALTAQSTWDLWSLKRRYPQWLPWIDADYGSAAYLPLVDAGHFTLTLAAAGGLVARPADAATARRIADSGW